MLKIVTRPEQIEGLSLEMLKNRKETQKTPDVQSYIEGMNGRRLYDMTVEYKVYVYS